MIPQRGSDIKSVPISGLILAAREPNLYPDYLGGRGNGNQIRQID